MNLCLASLLLPFHLLTILPLLLPSPPLLVFFFEFSPFHHLTILPLLIPSVRSPLFHSTSSHRIELTRSSKSWFTRSRVLLLVVAITVFPFFILILHALLYYISADGTSWNAYIYVALTLSINTAFIVLSSILFLPSPHFSSPPVSSPLLTSLPLSSSLLPTLLFFLSHTFFFARYWVLSWFEECDGVPKTPWQEMRARGKRDSSSSLYILSPRGR